MEPLPTVLHTRLQQLERETVVHTLKEHCTGGILFSIHNMWLFPSSSALITYCKKKMLSEKGRAWKWVLKDVLNKCMKPYYTHVNTTNDFLPSTSLNQLRVSPNSLWRQEEQLFQLGFSALGPWSWGLPGDYKRVQMAPSTQCIMTTVELSEAKTQCLEQLNISIEHCCYILGLITIGTHQAGEGEHNLARVDNEIQMLLTTPVHNDK